MRRFSLWLRARPVAGDTALMLLLLILEVPVLAGGPPGIPAWPFMLVGLGLVLTIPFRRRWPLTTAYIAAAAGLLQLLTHQVELGGGVIGVQGRPLDVVFGIYLYTVVAYVGRRQAALYLGVLLLGAVIWSYATLPGSGAVIAMMFIVVFLALCWVAGEFVGARRAYHSEVEQRLSLLETEQDQQARIAVGEERARIARELHDVVAHAVSVMVVQSEGAAYAVRSSPDLAEQTMRTVAQTGRDALTELRRLLGVLRSEKDADTREPQPGAQSLAELAERVRAVGVPVVLELSGDLDDLPMGVGLGVYRIAQEALTNTIKHAGPGASARVLVRRADERVELEIVDRGHGGTRALAGVSGGNGLIGMRERANVFGGTLAAGPHGTGGWRVHAVLPLDRELGD